MYVAFQENMQNTLKSSPGHIQTSLNQLCAPNKIKIIKKQNRVFNHQLCAESPYLPSLLLFRLATRHVNNGSVSLRQ